MTTKLFLLFASLAFFGNTATKHPAAFVVTGVVKDKQTGTPIQYVHVFTRKGEEEAITNKKGEFQFRTWSQAAELTTEKEGYMRSTSKLNLPAPGQTIFLLKE